MNYAKVVAVLLTLGALSACTATPQSEQGMLANLVVPTPQVADGRYQLEVAKLTEVITRGEDELDAEAMGQLLYRRGSLYDALGLATLARIDFNRALDYQPRLADAYNYLGIHYTQVGQFDYAYEALDAALELEPEHPYAYLNRGVAGYYDGRFDLALADLEHFYQADPDDPYRALWRYLAKVEVESAEQAKQELAAARLASNSEAWGWGIVDLYVGGMSEQTFLQSYATQQLGEDETLAERMCEAYFYLGKLQQLQGKWDTAAVYFRLALATNVHLFLEHRYATMEMDASQARATYETKPNVD
ncbi:lipoprotein NlpI [Pseudidiomarina aquimaris]|uniref:lipoprotein NlpI n=1 Tax=Pseudidiomarina aquimaris TaxID=641841 RepID=UPI003A96E27B